MSAIFKKLQPSDSNVTPFRSYKTWTTNNTSGSDGVDYLRAEYYEGKLALGDPSLGVIPQNPDGSYPYVLWDSLQHLFYNDNLSRFRQLHAHASVLNIPQLKLGEGIKPETVVINDYSQNNTLMKLVADEQNRIIDTSLDTTNYVDNSYCVAYYGFNEKFREVETSGEIKDFSRNNNTAKFVNLNFTGGLQLQDEITTTTGYQANFQGDGYVRIDDYSFINFKADEDFAISFAIQTPTPGATLEWLISKEGESTEEVFKPQLASMRYEARPYNNAVYPYRIYLDAGNVIAASYDGETLAQLVAPVASTSEHQYIVFNKSGSVYELWVDNSLESTTTKDLTLKTHNSSNVYIGSKDQSSGFYSGSIDEVRFWSKGLSAAEIGSLSTNTTSSPAGYNTDIVGNVMPAQGMAVISSPHTRYRNVLLGDGDWDYTNATFNASWKSTQTIYEYETICSVNMDEYNSTLNASAIKDGDSYLYKNFVTGSEFTPYVTTIGLYDDYGRLLAIGKLSRPIQKRNDININYVVRFDV